MEDKSQVKAFNVVLGIGDYDRLTEIAKSMGLSRSAAIRIMINQVVSGTRAAVTVKIPESGEESPSK